MRSGKLSHLLTQIFSPFLLTTEDKVGRRGIDPRESLARGVVAVVWMIVVGVSLDIGAHAQTPPIRFSGIGFINGVQMTGAATWHYGSDQQSGTVRLVAFASGQSKM